MKGGQKTCINFLSGKRNLCVFTLGIAFLSLSGQISVSGYVYNSENEEALAGIRVYLMETQQETTTTDSGYFSIFVDNAAFVYVIAKAAGFGSTSRIYI